MTARTVRSDFYIDDPLTGADTLSAAHEFQRNVHDTLLSAQLPLRIYMSNSLELFDTLDSSFVEQLRPLRFGDGAGIGIMGLQWDPVQDCFCLSTYLSDLEQVMDPSTRSEIARIYDQLGFLSPVTIRAEIVL